jgi:O-antigen/teichoic acid export membrane protein
VRRTRYDQTMVTVRPLLSGVADQGGLALASFAVTVTVARGSSTAQFGTFALVQGVALMILAAARAWIGYPLIIGLQQQGNPRVRLARGAGLLAAGYAVAMAAVLLLAGCLFSSPARDFVVAYAIAVPAGIGLDVLRSQAHGVRRPGRAAMSSLLMCGACLTGLLLTRAVSSPLPGAPILVWGFANYAVVVVVIARHFRGAFDRGATQLFVSVARPSWPGQSVGLLAAGALKYMLPWVVGLAGGLAVAGTFRAGQAVVGIYAQTATSLLPQATAGAAAEHLRTREWPRRSHVAWVRGQAIFLALATTSLAVMPQSWGWALFGESWEGASRIVFVLLAAAALDQLVLGYGTALRVMHDSLTPARIRVVMAFTGMGLVYAGVTFTGGIGGAVGLLIANALGFAIARRVTRALRRAREVRR